MDKRQAFIISFWAGAILAWASSCTPINTLTPVPTLIIPIASLTPTVSAPILAESSPTPNPCLGTRGQVDYIAFDSPALPHFYIYLPECYHINTETRYPVLYLLHGQGYESDQWLRLGAIEKAAALMDADEISPFLIVLPSNITSWRGADVDAFGEVLVNELLPYIDENYRTLAERDSRALGGISRGGGWAIRYGMTRRELFGAFGAHSPSIFYKDYQKLDNWLAEIPAEAFPQIYLDVGDTDSNLGNARIFVDLLADAGVIHEWHLYAGGHEENYWRAHVEEYLRWYSSTFE